MNEYFENIIDLSKIKLAKGQVLVERKVSKTTGTMALPTDGKLDPVMDVVIKSNGEGIEEGDIIIAASFVLGEQHAMKKGNRYFLLAYAHEIKLWVKPDNYITT